MEMRDNVQKLVVDISIQQYAKEAIEDCSVLFLGECLDVNFCK